jgi:cell division protein FtsB
MNLRKNFSGQIIIFKTFVAVLIFGMISGTVFQFSKVKEYRKQITSLNNQIEITEQQIDYLKNTESDDSDLEYIARNKLNMVKEDEIVYIVVE